MEYVQFLFDNQLIAGVEKLIRESKNKLLLISPFIDLDRRIQDALREKITKHDFELRVLFGKNEHNYYKSIKKDSFDFLKQFPDIEIRYNDRLHAKFYKNDFDYIMTSLNLYDYSLAKNIEVGIICNFGKRGLIGKVVSGTENLIIQGVDKVGKDVFGMSNDVDPVEKFESIFNDSTLLFKTRPIVGDADGIKGIVGGKKLNGFNIELDNFNLLSGQNKLEGSSANVSPVKETNPSPAETLTGQAKKTQSASQLAKKFGVSQADIVNLMLKKGLIDGDQITPIGHGKGLVMKNYMGKDYIAYPENLPELNEFVK
jgi:hypothetical protein